MNSKTGLNFLSLLPGTLLTILTITVAFLRFYDQQDFAFLQQIPNPRLWSNRLTVAALVVATINFGVEWNRRNRETNRLAQEDERRSEEEGRRSAEDRRRSAEAARAANDRAEERERANRERNRATEERERAARRARIQNRWIILQIRYQLEPNEQTRRALIDFLAFLQEYGE